MYSNVTLEPFCNIPKRSTSGARTDCTYDHLSVGVCNLDLMNTLSPEYQVCTLYPPV